MSKFGSNLYGNSLNYIDTSRNNVNRILNPPNKSYTIEARKTISSETQAEAPVVDKAAAGKLEERRQSGAIAGAVAKGIVAGNVTGASRNAAKSAASNAADNNRVESCKTDSGFKLDLSNNGLLNGIILAEVLGKPKYFKKGRW